MAGTAPGVTDHPPVTDDPPTGSDAGAADEPSEPTPPAGTAAVEDVEPSDPVDPAADDRSDRSDRLFPVRTWQLGLEALVVGAVAWAWAAVSYRVDDMSLRVPINSTGDARLITNIVRNIADQGWWTTNPDLGYPAGQQLYDFPHAGETWQLALLRLLTLATDDPGLLMNAYFLAGIGVAAIAAFLALRHLRFGFGLSMVGAVALTWLPFRIGHGEYHLFRTSFWWVPLSFVVMLWVLHWRERLLRDPDPPPQPTRGRHLRWTLRRNVRPGRVLVLVAMLVLLAGSETMTTAFTLVLLALTGVVAALRRRDPATLVVHGLAMATIGVTVGLLFSPVLRHVADNGANDEAGRRQVTEQELFGLKLSSMLLPDASHRWEALGQPEGRIRESTIIPSEAGQSIGLLGAAGFLGAVAHALTRGWGGRRRDTRPLHDRAALRDAIGLFVVVAALVATVSGGAILLSLLGLSQIRVWNRMSLLIGVASLAYALTWLERCWHAIGARITAPPGRGRRWFRTGAGALLVLALVAGVLWDGAHVVVDPAAADDRWVADDDYVDAIDEAMPDRSAVFQLPVVRFPEEVPPGNMADYDHLRGFIHTDGDNLRWSYGAMKGRTDGDWQLAVRKDDTVVESLPALIGLGFDGLWVDSFGYGAQWADVRDEIESVVTAEPIVSAEGRVYFYDLGPLRDRLIEKGRSPDGLRQLARERFGIEPGP